MNLGEQWKCTRLTRLLLLNFVSLSKPNAHFNNPRNTWQYHQLILPCVIYCFPLFKKNQMIFDFSHKCGEYILQCRNLVYFFFFFLQTFNYWNLFLIYLTLIFKRNYFQFQGVPVVKHFKWFRIDDSEFFNQEDWEQIKFKNKNSFSSINNFWNNIYNLKELQESEEKQESRAGKANKATELPFK